MIGSFRTQPRGIVARLAAWCVPPCLVLLVMWLSLGGPARDWRIPLSFDGDALFYLEQTRSTIDHGWWWTNPSLAAPFAFQALLFPQNANTDQAIIWVISRFTGDVGLVQNLAFLVFLAIGAVTAYWCFRQLGISALGSAAAAVLFAICPFVLYRNVVHFALMIYLVPFPATVAILLAAGPRARLWPLRRIAIVLAGCFLIGLNYIYFPFFGCILIVAGALVGAARSRTAWPIKAGAGVIAVIAFATALNLVPTYVAWNQFGRLEDIKHSTGEAELYGLKIRHLVTPVTSYGFPPFDAWLANDSAAEFPLENENMRGRLGMAGTVGFLGLLGVLLLPMGKRRSEDDVIPALAVIALAAVLVATIGGFASLFSLFVSPEIRGYNRITPFIAFCALAALAVWVDRFTASRPWAWRAGIWAAFLVFGVLDQRPITWDIAKEDPRITRRVQHIGALVADLETRLPSGAMVFQLPIRPFPADGGLVRMGAYDHFRPYLVSHNKLRWSSGAMTHEGVQWERAMEATPPEDLPSRLRGDGFSVVWINRDGYKDRGEAIARALSDGPDGAPLLVETTEFIVLDLRRPATPTP